MQSENLTAQSPHLLLAYIHQFIYPSIYPTTYPTSHPSIRPPIQLSTIHLSTTHHPLSTCPPTHPLIHSPTIHPSTHPLISHSPTHSFNHSSSSTFPSSLSSFHPRTHLLIHTFIYPLCIEKRKTNVPHLSPETLGNDLPLAGNHSAWPAFRDSYSPTSIPKTLYSH